METQISDQFQSKFDATVQWWWWWWCAIMMMTQFNNDDDDASVHCHQLHQDQLDFHHNEIKDWMPSVSVWKSGCLQRLPPSCRVAQMRTFHFMTLASKLGGVGYKTQNWGFARIESFGNGSVCACVCVPTQWEAMARYNKSNIGYFGILGDTPIERGIKVDRKGRVVGRYWYQLHNNR